MGSVDHVRLEELKERGICVVALKLAHVLDILQFFIHKWAVGVALAMHKRKNSMTVLPAILAGEPTRRLREEAHSDEEEDGWNHLETPWNTECGGAVDEGAAVGDIEHNQDAPGDGPLLSSN